MPTVVGRRTPCFCWSDSKIASFSFGVTPTEFDGRHDALLQEFDRAGRKHMEYVRDHGFWSDFPFQKVVRDFRDYYPEKLFDVPARKSRVRFEEESPLQ